MFLVNFFKKINNHIQEKNQAVADKEDIATSAVSKDDKTTTIKEHLENNDENHLENQPVEGEKVNDLIEIEVNKNIEKVDESVKNEENEDNGKNEEAMIESDNQEGSFEIKSDSYNIGNVIVSMIFNVFSVCGILSLNFFVFQK